jgi:signal transduction histidine kinase/CheY-like chemotaxis protein
MEQPSHREPPDVLKSAEQEVIDLFALQMTTVPWIVLLSMLTLAVMASAHYPLWMTGGWMTLVTVVLLIRWHYLHKPSVEMPMEGQIRRAIWLSGLNGVTHALSTIFFPALSELERSVMTTMLAGMSTAAVATTGGHPPIYVAYALPVLGAVSFNWLLASNNGKTLWLNAAMAFLTFCYLLVLMKMARSNYQTLQKSVALRQRETALNKDLAQALATAEQANAAKTRFLAAASHDLRQPLHTLTLFSAALQAQPLDGRSGEIVFHMNTTIRSLGDQLSGLLDLSKLDAHIVHPEIVDVALHPLLQRLHQQYAQAAQLKSIAIHLTCAHHLCVRSDAVHLTRIIHNLLDNALKYCDGGHVWINAQESMHGPDTPGHVSISVCDTGRGIAPEHQRQVFEEFFQLQNPERDRSKGLGLGLSIVQRLCELLNIELTMHSELGVGTQFELRLAKGHARVKVEHVPATALRPGICILVIDDEAEIRLSMNMLMSSLGAEMMLASNIEEALHLSTIKRPDIVLADLRLRGEETGIKAIRALRELHPDLPAVLVSGDTAADRLQEAQAEGLILLHKPVPLELLSQAIEHVLSAEE